MITKANIILFVNETLLLKLNSTSTELDIALQLCLNDLSNANLLPAEDTTQTLALNSKTLDYPTAFKQLISIVLNDGTNDGEPLKPIPGGMVEYDRLMKNFSAGTGPTHYTEFNKKFYLWTPAGASYTATIKHYKFHAQSVATIEFGDEFTNAIYWGTALFKAVLTQRNELIQNLAQMYGGEKEVRRLAMPIEPMIIGS
jgi:hypothetical protein